MGELNGSPIFFTTLFKKQLRECVAEIYLRLFGN